MSDYLWDSLFGDFDSIQRRFEKMFSDLSGGDSKTYGYTMYQGPDGIPHVREFGNAVNEFSPRLSGASRDPLTDVTRNGEDVFVTVELPGVKKEDIVLEGNGNSLKVSVDSESKRFDKTVALPCEVDEESFSAEYNNGILEVRMKAKDSAPGTRRIRIE